MPPLRTVDYLAITSTLAAGYEDTSPPVISVPGRGYGNLGVPDEYDPEFTDVDQPRDVFIYSPYQNFMHRFIDSYITERHTERVETTDYPVESGFIHSDHAVVYPTIVEITGMSSNFSLLGGGAENSRSLSPRSENAWVTMREMMHNRTPMFLETRLNSNYLTYSDMIITDLETTLDVQTGASLPYRIVFKQIRQQYVRFQYGTMIDPNRVPDIALVEATIRDNENYSGVIENAEAYSNLFAEEISPDVQKRAEINKTLYHLIQKSVNTIATTRAVNTLKLNNTPENVWNRLDGEIYQNHRELEFNNQRIINIGTTENPINVLQNAHSQFNNRGQDIRVYINAYGTGDPKQHQIIPGGIIGNRVNLEKLRGTEQGITINGQKIGIRISKGTGRASVEGNEVNISNIADGSARDQTFELNGKSFTLAGTTIDLAASQVLSIEPYTYTNNNGNIITKEVPSFSEAFPVRIAEHIQGVINTDPSFDVTVTAFGPAERVQFHIQGLDNSAFDLPVLKGRGLFGPSPTPIPPTNIGERVARLLQDAIRGKFNNQNVTVTFELGGRFVIRNLGEFPPTILEEPGAKAIFGDPLPNTTGFTYVIDEVQYTVETRRNRQDPILVQIAAGKLIPKVPLVSDPDAIERLRGNFIVVSNGTENPMPFVNTARVWDDWDLMFIRKEELDELAEITCDFYEGLSLYEPTSEGASGLGNLSDSRLRGLTREEINSLFPGIGNR